MINNDARECMYDKINRVYGDFNNLSEEDKFLFLMSNSDVRILNWLGKFIYRSFQIKDWTHCWDNIVFPQFVH